MFQTSLFQELYSFVLRVVVSMQGRVWQICVCCDTSSYSEHQFQNCDDFLNPTNPDKNSTKPVHIVVLPCKLQTWCVVFQLCQQFFGDCFSPMTSVTVSFMLQGKSIFGHHVSNFRISTCWTL